MKKVTAQKIEAWLGSDNTKEEAIKTLLDIANGKYKPEDFKYDVLMYGD